LGFFFSSESGMSKSYSLLNLAGLGVLVANHTNGLAGTLTRARVGGSSLAPHGQTATMSDSAITIDRLQALQVTLQFAPKVPFDQHLVARDCLNDLVDLMRRQVLRAQIRIDIGLLQNALRCTRSDPVNVGQRRFDAFIGRNLNS
jgi:hypothetical protein